MKPSSIRSAIALGIMTAASLLVGWVVAGRVLRPLQDITATTQRISADSLHERLAMPGPGDELILAANRVVRAIPALPRPVVNAITLHPPAANPVSETGSYPGVFMNTNPGVEIRSA